MHYLDSAATTWVLPEVAEEADRVLRTHFANPSSLYAPGARAEEEISRAREAVAASLGCTPAEVFFTGSGTEGNNLALRGAAKARSAWADHIVATGYEHPGVHNTVRALEKDGWSLTLVNPDAFGHVDPEAVLRAVTPKTALVAAMHVNNEIGSVLDVAALAAAVKERNSRTAVHVDGVQAWGKLPLRLSDTAIDSYTVSGHKIHAPKGVGALYLRRGYHLAPTLYGGHQERGFRPGTENTAYIAALGKAIALARAANTPYAALRAKLVAALREMDGIELNSPDDALPCIVNFSVDGIKSETMLHFLESRDIYVSSGSACSKGEPSHTLMAMGLPRARAETAIRVSFCSGSTADDVDALLAALAEGCATLARMRRR